MEQPLSRKKKMTTVKEILTANRDSVISSIKWVFQIWKSEDVKIKMVEFLAFAEENASVELLVNSKKVKSDLKVLVQKMAISQKREQPKDNRKWYEIAEDIADERGLTRDSRTGKFYDISGKEVQI